MTMMMYGLHSTLSPCSLPSTADNGHITDIKMVYHVDGADCCLIGIALGVNMKKNMSPLI